MTREMCDGEITPSEPMNPKDLMVWSRVLDETFAQRPPSKAELLAAKRAKVAHNLNQRTEYLARQLQ